MTSRMADVSGPVFFQDPCARRLMSKLVQVAGKGRAELRNPLPDRFVRDVEPPLG